MVDFGFSNLFKDELFWYFFIFCNALAVIIWIITIITKNHSYMDKLWPILPAFYAWIFILSALFLNPSKNSSIHLKTYLQNMSQSAMARLWIIVSLITIESIKLTYIFWRKGYYKRDFEDLRWNQVKQRFNYPERQIGFQIFSLVFISMLQNWILFGYALPIWYIATNKTTQGDVNFLDGLVICLFVASFAIELIADLQQQRFQKRKYMWIKNKNLVYKPEEIEDYERGFLCKGIFKYSRHPNYFGDILIWWSVYLFTISAKYSSFLDNGFNFFELFNYSILTAFCMTFIIRGTASFTEKLSASKYPEYSHYQSKVSCIIPWFKGYVPIRD